MQGEPDVRQNAINILIENMVQAGTTQEDAEKAAPLLVDHEMKNGGDTQ